ncbi:bifunctional non-homologous end joining protein LigD [Thermocatellispora tengchongensis]|uniref:Bifunctional non-homologous end joining protein LigD n=1 Tax=Thermocatellispora tengchongensis TaxID=1073253 RepID=A0A840PUH7_9ACTN|nr:DNA polymerase ligase N-terminal domain-containing protein [Thermocatellispora tengchongensis]MBB5139555.1 bifunctional non-homologous end joining protein LigD [Thermocatellispora tengchongensis]
MPDKLGRYRRKRDPERTPEPVPAEGPLPRGDDDTFVIQEHHARSLHWDLRLERDGVLVSWAVPKGLPPDPAINHLAVHTEDHPLEYATFEGEIPRGEYGGGTMTIWDRGRYETEKWTDREVKIVLHGSRASGRYVLFQTRGKNWMIHRMDPPDASWQPPPAPLAPMLPVARDRPPRDRDAYQVEFAWGGARALAYVEGGRLTLRSGDGFRDVTSEQRWLRPIGGALGSRAVVLDGELISPAGDGTPIYVCYDLLYDDGRALLAEPYARRRAALEALEIAGPRWQTAPAWPGGEIGAVRQAAREQGLPGVVAKRLDAPYEPGAESSAWIFVST